MFTGDFVRQKRLELGMSLVTMARATGLDITTLQRVERMGVITPRSAERIAPVIGCDVKVLKPVDYRGQSPRRRRG